MDDKHLRFRHDILSRGRPLLLSVIASVDTSVGKRQARTFDKLLRPIQEDLTAVLVNSDLPFTLNRFKETERLKHLKVLSDDFDQSFGRDWPGWMRRSLRGAEELATHA